MTSRVLLSGLQDKAVGVGRWHFVGTPSNDTNMTVYYNKAGFQPGTPENPGVSNVNIGDLTE